MVLMFPEPFSISREGLYFGDLENLAKSYNPPIPRDHTLVSRFMMKYRLLLRDGEDTAAMSILRVSEPPYEQSPDIFTLCIVAKNEQRVRELLSDFEEQTGIETHDIEKLPGSSRDIEDRL